jgi:hypothetical protein
MSSSFEHVTICDEENTKDTACLSSPLNYEIVQIEQMVNAVKTTVWPICNLSVR